MEFETRRAAGPFHTLQSVLSGGPYTVWSPVRQVRVVCAPHAV